MPLPLARSKLPDLPPHLTIYFPVFLSLRDVVALGVRNYNKLPLMIRSSQLGDYINVKTKRLLFV